MALAGAALADCAPEVNQQRVLARYSFLYADAALEWLRRWRNQLKRNSETRSLARDAKPLIDGLENALAAAGEVRDYLAAKRQSLAGMRADDIHATVGLWLAVSPKNVQAITTAAVKAYDVLNQEIEIGAPSVAVFAGLDREHREAVCNALPTRNNSWYLAADTAADLRAYTLPAAQGGELGRRIAQINDVAQHLDVLLRIAPVLEDALVYDWLVRSAIAVELSALLDLSLGPPEGESVNVMFPLARLLRADRDADAIKSLSALRSSIGAEGWDYVRWLRNKLGAHIDLEASMLHIHQHLLELDYRGIVSLSEHVLDWLDALGAEQPGLPLVKAG